MGKSLSLDLRSRLVAAVSEGMSRRGAAERFGVSAASVVRWVAAVNTTGTVEAKPQGGDTRSHRIEAFSGAILAAVAAQKDISLVQLAELLHVEHGVSFGASTVWRCLDRHNMTYKKKQRTPPSRSGPTSQSGAGPGSQPNLILIQTAWSSSMRPAPRPGWPGYEAAP
jgi:transposase